MLAVFKKTLSLILAVQLICNTALTGAVFSAAENLNLLISEVQTASETSASQEFVELYNPGGEPVDLEGWWLEYKSASGDNWLGKAVLSGTIAAQGFYIISTTDYLEASNATMNSGLAASGGHLRLITPTAEAEVYQLNDLVGWGSADSAEGDEPAVLAAAGESIQRCFVDGELIDSDSNLDDFKIYDQISPGDGYACSDDDPPAGLSCEGVTLSEVLPNPAGADADQEFIELYNPTEDFISLAGCSLEVGSGNYEFGNLELASGEYQAFYDDQTNITLPNAAGATVYLIASDDSEISSVDYAPDLDDDQAWAWFEDEWQATYSPTPNQANDLQASKPCPAGESRDPDTGRCRGVGGVGSTLKPCRSDQRRNPATNRCRSILVAAASLKPCEPGQARNPTTNRCRSVNSTSQLKPCKAGQERNPATNRCRKINADGTNLKPCAPGQIRNPETNRCRRVTLTSGGDGSVLGSPATIPTSPLSAGIVATAAGMGLLYGAYEFRGDIRNKLHLIRQYFSHRHHSGS